LATLQIRLRHTTQYPLAAVRAARKGKRFFFEKKKCLLKFLNRYERLSSERACARILTCRGWCARRRLSAERGRAVPGRGGR
jgi:hypothetical protein